MTTRRKNESIEDFRRRDAQYHRELSARRRTKDYRKDQVAESSTIDAPLQKPSVEISVPYMPAHGLNIALIMDAQVKDGVPIDHLVAYGKYIAAHRPDVILCIGDFADMRSLNRHDALGSKQREGLRYQKDIDSTKRAMDAMMAPIERENGYRPLKLFLLGNHEDLITRYVNAHPEMEEKVAIADLGYEQHGWVVASFLQPVVLGGVAFCHYFSSGVMGRPYTKAHVMLKELGMSCVAGHQQGRQIAWARRADGGERCAIISGSFYQHDEDYMGPFQNRHWRGTYWLHEVRDGTFAEMALTVNYLLRKWK